MKDYSMLGSILGSPYLGKLVDRRRGWNDTGHVLV